MNIIELSALPLWVMGDKKGLPSIYYGARSFVDAGHEVHFITPLRHLWRSDLDVQWEKSPREENYDGIHVHRFTIPFLPFLRRLCSVKRSYPRLVRYPMRFVGFLAQGAIWMLFTITALTRALRITRAHRPDVVYAHNGIASAAAYLLAKRYRVPNITKIYGTFLSQIPWLAWYRMLYFPEVLGFKIPCAYLMVDNDGTQGDRIAERLHVPPARLKFWMNGVDKDMYDPLLTVAEAKKRLGVDPGRKVSLTLGRLDSWKRVDRLIMAMPDIISRYPNVLFVIVGDGNEMKNLADLTKAEGVENSVRFEGAVPHDEVKNYLHAADLFVSVQDVTNFGIHVMEAMVCGRCVVTLNNGATGEFIRNNETGILLEPDALQLLPSTIVSLLGDDERRHRIGQSALRYAHEHFQTWDERMKAEVALIENLVDVKRRRG